MKRRYTLFSLTGLVKKSINKKKLKYFQPDLMGYINYMALFMVLILMPLIGFTQNAKPILDLNSATPIYYDWGDYVGNLDNPFGEDNSMPNGGWTRNSNANVKSYENKNINFDFDNPTVPFYAESPELTGMNLGPSRFGTGRFLVGLSWKNNGLSGRNNIAILYNNVSYAVLITGNFNTEDGRVVYYNGATDENGATEVAVPASPSPPNTSWNNTTISIALPPGVSSTGKVKLNFAPRDQSLQARDDALFSFIRAHKYTGDNNYNYTNTFTENGSSVGIADPNMSIVEDGSNLSKTTITLTNPQAGDALSISGNLPSGISAVMSANNTIITLSGNASVANYVTAIKQIRFANSLETPSTTNRTINVVSEDPVSLASNTAVATIMVREVNDSPSGTNKTISVVEDAIYTFSAADFGFSDPAENDNFESVTISSLPSKGTLRLNGTAVTANQVIPVANIPQLTWQQSTANSNGNDFDSFTFKVTDDGGTANGGINTDPIANTLTINVTASADVSISKTASNSSPNVGSNVTFTIITGNAGPSNATNVEVSDPLPGGYTFVSASPSGSGSYNSSTGVWTVGNLNEDANDTLTLVATVKASGNYANSATVKATEADSDTTNNTATSTPVPVATADVSITKTVSDSIPNAGSNITFTITANNEGPSNATSVKVSDRLPAGYTFVSATPSGGTTYNSSTGVWDIGNLASGANSVLSITATVNPGGSYANTATITATERDPDTTNNSATSTPVPVPTADLSVSKTVSNNSPNVGSNVTFTITTTNAGPSNATGVSVQDALPNGYTFVSATAPAGTTYSSTTGVWTIGSIPVDTLRTLIITATVNASGTYTNTATVTATENDTDTTNNTATSTPVPVATADLSVSKTAGNNSPNVGSNITFTITANNEGPSNATSVRVTDTLPNGYTFVSALAPTGTTYDNSTGLWTIGTIPADTLRTLSITARVNAGGTYTNTATVTATENDPDTTNNTATSTPVPVATADVSITKTMNDSIPSVGNNVTFTIVVGNAGPSSATGISVNDRLPDGYTFVSASPSGNTTYNSTTGVWTINSLNNGSAATLNITATVNAGGSYANTATVSATERDPDTTNNSATSTPVPVAIADLSVSKTVNNNSPNIGSNVTFTLTTTNAGPSNATGVSVQDALPNGYTFVSATAPAGTSYNSTTGVWTIGNMPADTLRTLSITATVNSGGSYTNTATVTATENDTDTTNNTATSTPVPIAAADISISKTASNNSPNAGSNITFTITANNEGPSNATNVRVTDTLPNGYTFVSALAPTGTTYDNSTGLWTIGSMTNGASSTLTIIATVNASGTYANTATATATENDPDTANNSATSTPVPVATADISISKTASNNSPNVGSNVTFTLTATNAGPSNASNVKVQDLLPDGYTYVSATASENSTYSNSTGEWNIGNLINNASTTLTITATVNASGNYINTATVTATENDPDTTNNMATSTPVPVATADLSISKTVNNSNPDVGSEVVFTIAVSNTGPSNATNVVVNDVLPNGYTFVSATAPTGTNYNDTTGVWTIGNMANGLANTLTITARVNASGNYANTATVTASENDTDNTNNTATSTPVPIPIADMAVTKTADRNNPAVGDTITFTLTAGNAGPSNATNVRVTDALPAGYTFVSASATTYNSSTGIWTIGNLDNGADTALTITATVNPGGNYTNTATITANENDPDNTNNTATSTPIPVATADLAVTKTASNSSPDVGSNITFTITGSNTGPSTATGISVTDVLPDGYTFVSANATGSTAYNTTTGVWTIGSLTDKASATLSIIARVNASGNYTNTATISGNENDPNSSNDTARTTPVPAPTADLSVTKTAGNNSPTVGTDITFTVTAGNAGLSSATNVRVTDVLPNGYTFQAASASAGTNYNSSTGLWTIGNMASGTNSVLSITARVNPGGNYTNTATITGNETDPDTSNNTASTTPVPVASADVRLSKTASNNSPAVGSNITFTITASNTGPSNATNVRVNDALPNGYTFVSASAPTGTSYNSNTGIWTIGNLDNGADTTLTITATVNEGGSYANTATVTADEDDPDRTNNTAVSTPQPVATADISVSKTVNNSSPAVGSNVIFTITAGNAGPSNATNVKVTDTLPNGYTFVSAIASGNSTYNNSTGEWTIGNLSHDASTVLNITARVNASGSYANTATVTATENDPDSTNNTAVNTPVPVASADLRISKTAGNNNPNVGSNVVFTIIAGNAGPSNATNVSVNDVLPDGYTFVSASAPAGTTYNNTTGVWTIGNMASGVDSTLSITATVNASGTYANTATVTATENDPDNTNNSSTSTPVPVATADMAVTKTASSNSPEIGSNVTFTITARNNGPSNATNVRVNDMLPGGYTFVSASAPAGTTYNSSTGVWTIGDMANAANSELSITATVNASGNYANTATVSASENDPDATNNTSTNTPVPADRADVSVTKTASNNSPNVGSNITFTITAGNAGPSNATNVKVDDVLPDGYAFVSALTPAGTAYNNTTGVWNIGTLNNGASTVLTVTVRVNKSGSYSNTAVITADENDPDTLNNSATSSPLPAPVVDVSIIKTAGGSQSSVGDTITFTLVAHNAGPSDATGVSVQDLLRNGYTYVSASAPAGTSYDPATGIWNISNMASDTSFTLSIMAEINATGDYRNSATITSTENDSNPANNVSSVDLNPGDVADVSVTKSVINSTPRVGSETVFTLTARNAGPSQATNVVVNDLLPTGYTFVSVIAGNTYNESTGIWTIGNLASGASTSLNIIARVNASGNYTNSAVISASETDPDNSNNSAAATTTPIAVADVSVIKTASSDTPDVGSNVIFNITAANSGPSPATTVKVNDLLPNGYTFVSAQTSGSTTYNAASGEWTIGNLANGTNALLSITARVNASGTYANTATITATESDPDSTNNSATSTPVPVAIADVFVTKTASNNNPDAGSDIVFTITAGNTGPNNATNVTVTDTLPDGYTFKSAIAPAGTSYNESTGIWTIGSLSGGTNAVLSITATVNASGSYANRATVTATEKDPDSTNNSATSTPVPVAVADVSVTKTVSNSSPDVGTNVIFTITAGNAGPANATNVRVNDVLPGGYTFVSASAPAGTSYNNNTGIWTIGSLTNQASAVLSITATVNESGNYSNTATITAAEKDTNNSNNTATSTPVPVPTADVSVTKTASSNNPQVGSNVMFTITANNAGPSTATNVRVNDLLPNGYTFVLAVPSGNTTYDNTTGIWTIGNLLPEASTVINITATVNASGSYTNTARITATEQDPDSTNNSATITPQPVPVADVSVNKTASNNNPQVGSNLTFSIRARNTGPSAATTVQVNDVLPDGYTFVSASAPSGTTYNSNTGIWTIGNMALDADSTLTITATVNAGGNYANTATITATETDPHIEDNTATATPVPVAIADMSVTKTASNNSPDIGSNITFTITAGNAGPSAATNVRVNDALPNGYTFVSASAPAGTSYDNTTGIWTIGNMASGANSTLSITATVDATGSYANTATVRANENDPDSSNNSAVSTPVPVPVVDIAINKAGDAAPEVGQETTFVITVSNNGPSNATGVSVSDVLPDGYTFVSAAFSGGTSYDSSTGIWTVGQLTQGANEGFLLLIRATVNATGNYSNTAIATANEKDADTTNNTDTFTPVPVPVADMAVTKTASSNSPQIGSTLTFTVSARNAGPGAATNVAVTDTLPDGYTFVSAQAPAGTTFDNTTGIWTIGNMASGANSTLSIVATVNANGSYANTASVTATEKDPDSTNNSATATPQPVPIADVSVTKTASNNSPDIGDTVTFTIRAANAGVSGATNVSVNDALPNGYTFVSASAPAGTSYNNATGIWTIGNMASGTENTLTITATVNEDGNYTNTATIRATENDPDQNNNTAVSTPIPQPVADISVTKTVNNSNPDVGSNVIFSITAANAGPSNAANVKVADLLPSGYTFVSARPSGNTTYNNATGEWTIGNLIHQASTVLNITATVNNSGNYTNTATITATGKDPDTSNNSSTATLVPVPAADVSVTKTVSNSNAEVNDNVTFTITAGNAGPSAATNVRVTDTLPDGYTFVSVSAPAGTNYDNGTGIWTIGDMANGANSTLSIVARVNAAGNYTNTATVEASETDPNLNNNTASSGLTPATVADVSVTKTVSNSNPGVGSEVTFTITAGNAGPSEATNVMVIDALPNGYTFKSASAPAGTSYNNNTGIWTIGNMANGANSTLSMVATVNPAGNYTNTATILANEDDPDDSNNTASSTPVPAVIVDIAVNKAGDATPQVGEEVTFVITVSNNGPSDATGVSVSDRLPDGYTFTSARYSGGTIYDASTGIWTVGNLAKGGSFILLIDAIVNPTGNYSNTATATVNENDADTTNNADTFTPVPVAVADMAISKTAGTNNPDVGSNITFTITARNEGPSAATNVRVTDALPDGYTFVSATAPGGTTYDNRSGIWTIGSMASGTNSILSIVASVNAGGNYANTARVTASETDPDSTNNTATSSPVPVAVADVSVIKTASSGSPEVGTDITFNITVSNAGPSEATAVRVTDVLPSGYTFVSAKSSDYDPVTGIWTVGTLPNGDSETLEMVVKVKPSGNYANIAAVTATENDPDTNNNTAISEPIPFPIPVADVRVTKTIDDQKPDVGATVNFTITVSNAGASTATNVTANDLLPDGYTFISALPSGNTSYDSSTGIWTIGTLANGTSTILRITARVNASGNYVNTATVAATENDPDLTNNSASVNAAPEAVANLTVTKTVDNMTPDVGSEVTFTIRASNAGPSDATGVKVNDLLPGGYTFISATPSGNTTYDQTTGVWTIGLLANRANATLNITARVNPTGNYTNTATLTGNEKDPIPGGNTSVSKPEPVPFADVSISKTVNDMNPKVGSQITFTLIATNAGPSMATNVRVNDLLPDGYTFVSARPLGSSTYDQATSLWTIGNLASGANSILNIIARVEASGNYTNMALISADETDTVTSNNRAIVTPVPVPVADLAISKTVDNQTPDAGSNVTFTIRVTNAGPSSATEVKVNEMLPNGYTFVSETASAGTTYDEVTGSWIIGTLASGASAVLTVTSQVNNAGNYANTATVTAGTEDPVQVNNSSTATTTPVKSISGANISVNKSVDNAMPVAGTNVVFSIRVYNAGPEQATGVSVIEMLRDGYTFISADAPAGTSYDATTGLWSIGDVPNGTTLLLTITAKVNPTGDYTNTVTVNSPTPDPDPSDNTSTFTPDPSANMPRAFDDEKIIDSHKSVVISILDNDEDYGYEFDPSTVEIVTPSPYGTAIVNKDGTITYYTKGDYKGEYVFTYRVKDRLGNFTNVATVTIKLAPPELKIPNLFTPNGDGDNDVFEIRGLSRFAENNLTIINRWGNEVYRAKGYSNDWTGEGLNEGTYYYLLKVKDQGSAEWTVYKGWLTLIRSFKQ